MMPNSDVRRFLKRLMRQSTGLGLTALVMLASAPLPAQSQGPARAHEVICLSPAVGAPCPESFDFQHNGPVEFLAHLRTAPTPFSVAGLHKGWLLPSDLASLLAQVSSREACALVVMGSASHVPLTRSTIGQEALFLLDGVRTGSYPPTLHSGAYDSTRRDEILAWARQQSR